MEEIYALGRYKLKIKPYWFSSKEERVFFTSSSGDKISEISLSGLDLIHDVVTCGTPLFSNRLGMLTGTRKNEIRFKWFLLKSILKSNTGFLAISDERNQLDASEKGVQTYYLGMFITRQISRSIFGQKCLVHLKTFSRYRSIIKDNGMEPDLVGFNPKEDEYIVYEAKGRERVTNSMINHAKGQVQSVKVISGMNPRSGIVCVTHPTRDGQMITCSIYDPPVRDNEISGYRKEDLLFAYYYPTFELLKENGENNSCEFKLDERVQCRVMMNKELFSVLKRYENYRKEERLVQFFHDEPVEEPIQIEVL